ncbi:hypothetical protein [Mycobacteroides abscessus]|uniref:hypothetical protein n=1 Tax=Mycobacteroides abscessus TaxID=36809 RepID=UPI0009A631A2|nr:hypothetical protein [Mycobacteroides abscessus]MDO2968695.1 hypothetical protein [Mycobacteroides abscessus subsp. bolletii]MDO3078701.1 hypothetical protein [Mycobacteroides abscessus subsp. bolletii]SLC56746.1 Uncharacterised protein [Mycobacteroides abscessus subsp. bolletii]
MSNNVSGAFHEYLRGLSDEQWAALVAEVRTPAGGAPSLAGVTPESAPPQPSAASGGLQDGAELYRRTGASEIEYDETSPSQQSPAVKGMAAGADLYNKMHAKTTN